MRGLFRALPFLLVCLAVGALGTTLEEDHRLSMEFETPHTQWGRPYAQPGVRILFFVYGRGTQPREIIELMQRFDITAEAAYWESIVDTRNALGKIQNNEPKVFKL